MKFYLDEKIEYDVFPDTEPFSGSYANVYKVRRTPPDLRFGDIIALKVLKQKGISRDLASIENKGILTLREAMKGENAGYWNTHGLVVLLSDGSINIKDDNNNEYKAYEYQWMYESHRTIENYIKEYSSCSLDKTKSIVNSVVNPLKYLHGLGLVHGDIHPGNIFLDNYGNTLINDFGLVRFTSEKLESCINCSNFKTENDVEVSSDIGGIGHLILYLLANDFETPFDLWDSARKNLIPKSLHAVIEKSTSSNGICQYNNIDQFIKEFNLSISKHINTVGACTPNSGDRNPLLIDFNDGNIVRLPSAPKSKAERGEGNIGWKPEMEKYLGAKATVIRVDNNDKCLLIDLDDCKYWWPFEWLVKID